MFLSSTLIFHLIPSIPKLLSLPPQSPTPVVRRPPAVPAEPGVVMGQKSLIELDRASFAPGVSVQLESRQSLLTLARDLIPHAVVFGLHALNLLLQVRHVAILSLKLLPKLTDLSSTASILER